MLLSNVGFASACVRSTNGLHMVATYSVCRSLSHVLRLASADACAATSRTITTNLARVLVTEPNARKGPSLNSGPRYKSMGNDEPLALFFAERAEEEREKRSRIGKERD